MVENILTLGKLLSLWFCFLLHSILFLISQTSYRTYKNNELSRPIMGTIFLVILIICLIKCLLIFQDSYMRKGEMTTSLGLLFRPP